MFEREWARKRIYDDWEMFLHAEWTFDIHQLGYRHIKNKNGEWYRIYVRTKRGWFGATKWLTMQDVDTHEECCALLRDMVDNYTETNMNARIEKYHADKQKKKDDEERKDYCGYEPKGKIW